MSAWKSVALGALGALAVCIPFAIAFGLMPARAAPGSAPAPDARAALVADVAAYRTWTQTSPLARGGGCANPSSAAHDDCLLARQRFFTLHPAVGRYAAWWAETTIAERGATFGTMARVNALPPDDLADPVTIDRYLREGH
jgi:hypothetical protein